MYYLFSSLPCAIKINGEYKGTLSLQPLCLTLNLDDFIEIIPLKEFLPINFNLRNVPPNVKTISTFCGKVLFPLSFKSYPLGYKELLKKQFNNYDVFVKVDGTTKFYLQTPSYTIVETIPLKPEFVKIFYSDNRYIGLLFQCEKQILIIKEIESGNTIFNQWADEFCLEHGSLLSKTKCKTLLAHTIIYSYNFKETRRQIIREISPCEIKNETLFSLAFLECVNLLDDLKDFLAEGLPQEKIVEFLGTFDYVLPSPNSKYQFMLVGEKVKFVSLRIDNGLICDLSTD